ncbi:MAG: hypothetical protein JW852_10860 [Spirochaetales bacterium]|nr:hypothetical protein [Spirochaetales bacterium]
MGDFSKYVSIGDPVDSRTGLDKGVIAVAEKNDRVVLVTADLGAQGLGWFLKNAPERIVECGIAEANAAVVAAGLAAEGFIPVLSGFVMSTIARAHNQIRQSILVDRFNVKIIAREGAWSEMGISHNYVEGISATRGMPNLVIMTPADVTEAEKLVAAALEYVGPVFVRTESGQSPPPLRIFTDEYPFSIGKAVTVKEGRDVTIITMGYMLTEAIRSVEILEKEGIDVRIINMSTIKPLDEEAIIRAAEETGAIVTAENGVIIGSLGEGVAGVLAENIPTPMVMVGVDDEFSQSGRITKERDELKDHFKLGAADLASAVRKCIGKKAKK